MGCLECPFSRYEVSRLLIIQVTIKTPALLAEEIMSLFPLVLVRHPVLEQTRGAFRSLSVTVERCSPAMLSTPFFGNGLDDVGTFT